MTGHEHRRAHRDCEGDGRVERLGARPDAPAGVGRLVRRRICKRSAIWNPGRRFSLSNQATTRRGERAREFRKAPYGACQCPQGNVPEVRRRLRRTLLREQEFQGAAVGDVRAARRDSSRARFAPTFTWCGCAPGFCGQLTRSVLGAAHGVSGRFLWPGRRFPPSDTLRPARPC